MYGEHPNGGMTEVGSHNVDFFEDEFSSIGEIKQDLQLYELWLDNELSLSKGENLNCHQLIENSTLVSKRDTENLSVTENQPKCQSHS